MLHNDAYKAVSTVMLISIPSHNTGICILQDLFQGMLSSPPSPWQLHGFPDTYMGLYPHGFVFFPLLKFATMHLPPLEQTPEKIYIHASSKISILIAIASVACINMLASCYTVALDRLKLQDPSWGSSKNISCLLIHGPIET